MWAQILCYKNQGIHWYHCNPTFLWQINFTLVWRLISALIWDISGLWNRSDGRDYREKRIVISRFLALYKFNVLGLQRFGICGPSLVERGINYIWTPFDWLWSFKSPYDQEISWKIWQKYRKYCYKMAFKYGRMFGNQICYPFSYWRYNY